MALLRRNESGAGRIDTLSHCEPRCRPVYCLMNVSSAFKLVIAVVNFGVSVRPEVAGTRRSPPLSQRQLIANWRS